MTIGKAVILKGFKFPTAARASMARVPITQFDQDLARTAGRNGLIHLFDPADYDPTTGIVPDRASIGSLACNNAKATAGLLANGKPAIVPASAGAGWQGMATSFVKAESSFTVVIAYEATVASSTGLATLVNSYAGDDADVNRLQIYRFSGAPMAMAANGNDPSKGVFTTTHGVGIFVDAYSYDAVGNAAAVYDKSGSLAGSTTAAFTGDPSNGYPWGFGGFGSSVWPDHIGRILIFDRAMHLAGNLPTLLDTLALLKADYAL
ncbi:hypothetical protein BH09PSE4_BH09PSE4_21260 [soil metagenome]